MAQEPPAEYDDMNKVVIDRTRHIMLRSPLSSSRMNPMCPSVAGSRNPPLDRVDLTQRRSCHLFAETERSQVSQSTLHWCRRDTQA